MPIVDERVYPQGVAVIVDMAKSIAGDSIVAAVENVSSMPRQAGAFNFGRSAGVVHGVLGALGVPMELVSPVVWKSACGLRRAVNETQDQVKTRARELASRLWPEHAAEFAKVKNDGRAESALISRYWASKML
jgi:crossover junction endodeoxyribonuclease RuvC